MNIYPGGWPKKPKRPVTAPELARLLLPLQIIQAVMSILIFLLMICRILNG